jgi:ArsR family transcriptional regulator
MLLTKAKELARAARRFHALADETRLRIIECLLECEHCVCDLTDMLQTGQSRLSFHLKTLKEAGLLQDRKDGRWIYYSLNPEVLHEVEDLLAEMRQHRPASNRASRRCD